MLSTHESTVPPILEMVDVARHFTSRDRTAPVRAVDGVSLAVHQGETVGLIGESGSGKSTLARMMLRLETLNEGRVIFDGRDISNLRQRELRPLRKEMQMVFQDPFGSLNPRKRIGAILGDVFRVHQDAVDLDNRVGELLDLVGLSASFATRYPFELSGGQRQRVGIARAVALRPRLVVADEPVSALDVSVQAQVLNLLTALQRDLGLTYVIVAHDLGVMRHVADRIAVMYLGKIVEFAETEALLASPRHPYTEALLSAVPVPDPTARRRTRRIVLSGEVPSPSAPPSGCRFRTRCVHATEECASVEPLLRPFGSGHYAACHHPVLEHPSEDR